MPQKVCLKKQTEIIGISKNFSQKKNIYFFYTDCDKHGWTFLHKLGMFYVSTKSWENSNRFSQNIRRSSSYLIYLEIPLQQQWMKKIYQEFFKMSKYYMHINFHWESANDNVGQIYKSRQWVVQIHNIIYLTPGKSSKEKVSKACTCEIKNQIFASMLSFWALLRCF